MLYKIIKKKMFCQCTKTDTPLSTEESNQIKSKRHSTHVLKENLVMPRRTKVSIAKIPPSILYRKNKTSTFGTTIEKRNKKHHVSFKMDKLVEVFNFSYQKESKDIYSELIGINANEASRGQKKECKYRGHSQPNCQRRKNCNSNKKQQRNKKVLQKERDNCNECFLW